MENLMENVIREKSNNAKTAIVDLHNKVQNGGNQLEKIAHGAGEKAGAMASDFANSASDLAKSASDYVETGREYVKQNPLKGVAIAAVAGVVTGGILAMALRRRS
jgi:ElaB/YqjD/DUF883 family membrane-anchored ribosome-binding protein